jgi:hypothetical protein
MEEMGQEIKRGMRANATGRAHTVTVCGGDGRRGHDRTGETLGSVDIDGFLLAGMYIDFSRNSSNRERERGAFFGSMAGI